MALPKSIIPGEHRRSKNPTWRRPYSYLTNLDIDSESELEFDSEFETGGGGQKPFRLRAGAAGDDDDNIILDNIEGEKQKKPEEVQGPLTGKEKIARGLHYFKVGVLFLVWLVSAIFLMSTEEHVDEKKLLVIPADSPKLFIMPNQDIGNLLQIDISGPLVQEDALLPDIETREGAFLWTQIQRIEFNPDKTPKVIKNVSGTWLLTMVAENEIKYAAEVIKSHVFTLDESLGTSGDVVLYLNTNVPQTVTLKINIDRTPLDKTKGFIYGGIVLAGLYIMIIWEIVDRTFAAVISCTAAIAILAALDERPPLAKIITWLDVETLLLLFGMMVLVATLAESGIFDYLAVFAYKITKGKVWPLINCLCGFVTVLSAFLDNVTMMLLVTPVTIRLCEVLNLDPVPILMCMVIFSNVGAALTPVGDPPNVIITTNPYVVDAGVNFGTFVIHMLPGVVLGVITTFLHLRFKYRKPSSLQYGEDTEIEQLKHEIKIWEHAAAAAEQQDEDQVNEALKVKIERLKATLKTKVAEKKPELSYEELLSTLESEYPIRNKMLLFKSLIAFTFVVGLFALHSVPHLHHLSLGWTALLGAVMLFILADIQDVEAIISRVEWSTLLFFAALIILMEVLSALGLIELIGDLVVTLIKQVEPEHRLLLTIVTILWVSAIASAFLDNIPVTTMMIRIVISLYKNRELQLPLTPMIWALAFGACFGGNGTLIGASANVVCGGVAAQHGYNFGFVGFFLVGFPVVLNTVTVATLYLLLAHVVFTWH